MVIDISRCVIDIIQREAAAAFPSETCGLLFGDGVRIEAAQPCRNVAEHPDIAFEIDPSALIAAFRAERSGGRRIVGCYHSHPNGNALPSVRDAESAETRGWVWIIAGGDTTRAYRVVDGGAIEGRFDPLAISVA